MKKLQTVFFVVLGVMALIQTFVLYELYQKNETLEHDNVALRLQLEESQAALSQVQEKVKTLENKSVEKFLHETNKAVVSGWKKLLDSVNEELDRAKKAIGSDEENHHDREYQNVPDQPNVPGERT